MTGLKKDIELHNTNTFFREVLNMAGIGIMTLQSDRSIQFINLAALKIFGYKPKDLSGININTLFHNDSQEYLEDILSKINSLEINDPPPIEITGLHKDNSEFPIELTTTCNTSDENTIYTIIIRDITDSKKNEEDLKHQAYFDQLTDIPNRTLFSDRAENALNQAKRSDDGLAIIFIDLDDFKEINDTLGHEAGDIMLKTLSQRFINSARNTDTVSRRGGDEFTILMPRIKNLEDAAILAERILESNKEEIKIHNNSLYPKTSIGISVFPGDGDTVDILIKNADEAMYHAKKSGKNRYAFYNSDIKTL